MNRDDDELFDWDVDPEIISGGRDEDSSGLGLGAVLLALSLGFIALGKALWDWGWERMKKRTGR